MKIKRKRSSLSAHAAAAILKHLAEAATEDCLSAGRLVVGSVESSFFCQESNGPSHQRA